MVIVVVIGIISIVLIGRIFYPDNIAQTSPDGGPKGLKQRVYRADVAAATKIVSDIIMAQSTYGSQWKMVSKIDGEGDMASKIKAEVPVVVFTDDLEVTIKNTENDGEVQVDVHSQSRVGQSDFGENARHVRQFLEALDEKLK